MINININCLSKSSLCWVKIQSTDFSPDVLEEIVELTRSTFELSEIYKENFNSISHNIFKCCEGTVYKFELFRFESILTTESQLEKIAFGIRDILEKCKDYVLEEHKSKIIKFPRLSYNLEVTSYV